MWIGITGKAQSGKDTIFNILKEVYGDRCRKFAFADKLKESVCALLDIQRDQLEKLKLDTGVKLHLLDIFYDDYSTSGFVNVMRPINIRTFLQRYGTEAHRDVFGADFWVDQFFKGLPDDLGKIFVITDVRFENEAIAIHQIGGWVIRVDRPNVVEMEHPSERTLDDSLINITLNNNGNIEDLKLKVLQMLDNIDRCR